MNSIAILHPKFVQIGGAENLVANAAEVLAQQKWSIDIFTSEYKQGLWPNLDQLPVHTMTAAWRKIFKSKYIDAVMIDRQLSRQISDFDCIWAVNFPSPMWAKTALRRNRQAKGIWYCCEPKRNLYPEITEAHIVELDKHVPVGKRANNQGFYRLREHLLGQRDTLRNRRDRAWEKRVLQNFDFIQTVSEYAAVVSSKIYGLPAECCYAPVQAPGEFPRSTSAPWTVGAIATLAERKNLLNVSRALEQVLSKRSDVRVRFGAGRPEELHRFWKENGLAHLSDSRIEIVNTAKTSDLYRFYASLDLILYLTIDEPLGLIPIEAATVGTPSLLSDHAGPAELGKLGFGETVTPFDDDAIAAAIIARAGRRPSSDEQQLLKNLVRRHFGPELFMNRFTRQLEGIKV